MSLALLRMNGNSKYGQANKSELATSAKHAGNFPHARTDR